MKAIIQILVSALAVIISAYLLPGVHLGGDRPYIAALLLAVVLSFLNTFVKPFLILLTIPLTVFTLGLFLLVVNAIIIWLAQKILPGNMFVVDSIWWAIFFSVILSLTTSVLEGLLGTNRPQREE